MIGEPATQKWPGSQRPVGAVAPMRQYEPAGHARHSASVFNPVLGEYFPAEHLEAAGVEVVLDNGHQYPAAQATFGFEKELVPAVQAHPASQAVH